MTWTELLFDPKFLLTIGGGLVAGGIAVGRTEMKFLAIGKAQKATAKAMEALAEKLKTEVADLDFEKADVHDCHERHQHLDKLAAKSEENMQKMLEIGEKRMDKFEQWTKNTAEAVARLEGKFDLANGGSR